ncbi:uncharacterized protein LOC122500905 [Leptopilina heterotoma]|uniref:uncharacterized protein LOC122500905 n=1 Tax=Leptopilina heterotoma TaxID=63436 RepID=UPI001CA8D72C|nr:uncharacterized protein LOC122500905 [Leptopilina heterotoma]
MEETEVFPKLDKKTIEKLLPEDVVKTGETVGHISVLKLGVNPPYYEEVVISDVNSPSFFWIHLRSKLLNFEKFSKNLHQFYETESKKYRIPSIALEVGLNVAVKFSNKWHRGVIKGILPDGHSYVFFYDYGTVDNYYPNELYFLHRQFINLPAQAILCSLSNVKPVHKEWKKNIVEKFILKISSTPLCAEIITKNVEENSISVELVDTRGEEDININNWILEQEFVTKGNLPTHSDRNFSLLYFKKCLAKIGKNPSIIYNLNFNLEAPVIQSSADFKYSEVNEISPPIKNSTTNENQVFLDYEESYEAVYKRNQIKAQNLAKSLMTSYLLPRACPPPSKTNFQTSFKPSNNKNTNSENKTKVKTSIEDINDNFEFVKFSEVHKKETLKPKPSVEILNLPDCKNVELDKIGKVVEEVNSKHGEKIFESDQISQVFEELNKKPIEEIFSSEDSSVVSCDLPQFLKRTMTLMGKREERRTQENLRKTLEFIDKEDSPERDGILEILNL